MHGEPVPSSIARAALSACAIESELLNSERIEERFGSYGIEILSERPGLSKSALYSGRGSERTCRTYAVVRFANATDAKIGSEHEQVLAGDSIGAIFKAGGWTIRKETLHIDATKLPSIGGEIIASMRLEDPSEIAVHVYRLQLRKDGEAIDYATISEFHHPDYLVLADLRTLYPVDAHKQLPSGEFRELLEFCLDPA
jgi:hypothetical protein